MHATACCDAKVCPACRQAARAYPNLSWRSTLHVRCCWWLTLLTVQTLEAEADEETEEAAPATAAAGGSSRKGRPRQPSRTEQQREQVKHDTAKPAMNGAAHVKQEPAAAPAVVPSPAAAAGQTPASSSKAHAKPPGAAVTPAPAAAAAVVARTRATPRRVRAPLQRLPRPARGPDEGAGAALGQAVGSADAQWSISKEAASSSKQPPPRGAKRKRSSGKASTPPPPDTTETGTEDGDDHHAAAAAHPSNLGTILQQPQGKALPVSSRPAWLVQVSQGGSAALNRRAAKALPDDLEQPQQVEFMLGCSSCDYQQVRV